MQDVYPYPSLYPAYIYAHFQLPTHFNPEDGGSTILRNVGIQPPQNTAQ